MGVGMAEGRGQGRTGHYYSQRWCDLASAVPVEWDESNERTLEIGKKNRYGGYTCSSIDHLFPPLPMRIFGVSLLAPRVTGSSPSTSNATLESS